MEKGTQDYQDAEGRMDEKSRAPRTNSETPGLFDPKQSGFELDSSDGKAHDPPTETTKSVKSTHKPSGKFNVKWEGLQRKVNGLEKNYNDLNTN